jgi:hypothetical protein
MLRVVNNAPKGAVAGSHSGQDRETPRPLFANTFHLISSLLSGGANQAGNRSLTVAALTRAVRPFLQTNETKPRGDR